MVEVRPRFLAWSGEEITSSGSMPSRSCKRFLSAERRSLDSHQFRFSSSVSPLTVRTRVSSRPARRMEHHFRDGAGEKNLDGGETLWAVGQRINEARDGAIDFGPICDTRAAELGGVRDGGDVQQKIR